MNGDVGAIEGGNRRFVRGNDRLDQLLAQPDIATDVADILRLRDFQTVGCECGASPGQPCRDEDGTAWEYGVHQARFDEYFELHPKEKMRE